MKALRPLWTIALQAPLSMAFSKQEHWSGLPCPPPGDLLFPGMELMSLASPALADGFFTTSATWEAPFSLSLLNFVFLVIHMPKRHFGRHLLPYTINIIIYHIAYSMQYLIDY